MAAGSAIANGLALMHAPDYVVVHLRWIVANLVFVTVTAVTVHVASGRGRAA